MVRGGSKFPRVGTILLCDVKVVRSCEQYAAHGRTDRLFSRDLAEPMWRARGDWHRPEGTVNGSRSLRDQQFGTIRRNIRKHGIIQGNINCRSFASAYRNLRNYQTGRSILCNVETVPVRQEIKFGQSIVGDLL